MCVNWTSFANIFGWIPNHWRSTVQTFLSCWIQVATFRTNTCVQIVIVNKSLRTGNTFFIFLTPILWSFTSYASSICKHKWCFNRAGAYVTNWVVDLASWTSNTFLKQSVPVLSWRAVITILSIPNWSLNWTFRANWAVPKGVVFWAADTFLRDKIVKAFFWACLTF